MKRKGTVVFYGMESPIVIDGQPHLNLSLSLQARGLLVLMQLHHTTDFGGIPLDFLAKVLNTDVAEIERIFDELGRAGLLPWRSGDAA